MAYRIKNWDKFQHYKSRRPAWIKLYRDILDDIEWAELPGDAAKHLVLFWLIGSESEGVLPDIKRLSFRLRTSESKINQSLSMLSHWIEHYASNTLADCKQDAMPEKRREEKEKIVPHASKSASNEGFELFWKSYPKKVCKDDAFKAWKKVAVSLPIILNSIEEQKKTDQWQKDNGKFIPYPASWLNGKRWEDEITITNKPRQGLDKVFERKVTEDRKVDTLETLSSVFGGISKAEAV